MTARTGPRTTRRRGDAKRRLLEATVRTIQERGREGATVRQITSAAKADLGSITYHFGSKDELVDQALVAVCERWVDSLKGSGLTSAAGKTIGERIARSLGAFATSLPRNRPLALAFIEALATAERSPTVKEALRDSYEELRTAVAEGAGEGAGPLGHADAAAETVAGAIVALFDGVLIQLLLDPERALKPRELIASLGSLFSTGLVEAGYRRVEGSSLAEEVKGLVGQADNSEDGADHDDRRRRRRSARGDIYRLKPPRGSRTQAPPRYVVLLQAAELLGLPTALIAPVSSRAAAATFRPDIELDGELARVLVERLRAVDRKRLAERVGRLSASEQEDVDKAMAAVLALG
jgi:AcrR family transcriptional regulator/mRNA-degrading endonuclease toxin of MazEF toxin-antitoxin module